LNAVSDAESARILPETFAVVRASRALSKTAPRRLWLRLVVLRELSLRELEYQAGHNSKSNQTKFVHEEVDRIYKIDQD
jgi:hypothetical protein